MGRATNTLVGRQGGALLKQFVDRYAQGVGGRDYRCHRTRRSRLNALNRTRFQSHKFRELSLREFVMRPMTSNICADLTEEIFDPPAAHRSQSGLDRPEIIRQIMSR